MGIMDLSMRTWDIEKVATTTTSNAANGILASSPTSNEGLGSEGCCTYRYATCMHLFNSLWPIADICIRHGAAISLLEFIW